MDRPWHSKARLPITDLSGNTSFSSQEDERTPITTRRLGLVQRVALIFSVPCPNLKTYQALFKGVCPGS